jgi:hypothetical protein
MKIAGILSLILLSCLEKANAWGFFGHQVINRMACFTLPPELFAFYKVHIDYITAHAVDPDKRRYSDPAEPPRHFIDNDHYGKNPFDSIPVNWQEAVKQFTEDSLNKFGIVPWHIHKVYYKLVTAFESKDVKRILYYSANLGHYIADSHVPLHSTENYNGQLTNQVGIHGFWESRLPELFSGDYDFFVGRASYIEDIQTYCWKIVRQSFAALDSVLIFERKLNDKFDKDKKYSFELRGNQLLKMYSYDYAAAYHTILDGQVERRMQQAIISVGSIWYTAWVQAGFPELDTGKKKSDEEAIPDDEEKQVDSTKKFMNKRECD